MRQVEAEDAGSIEAEALEKKTPIRRRSWIAEAHVASGCEGQEGRRIEPGTRTGKGGRQAAFESGGDGNPGDPHGSIYPRKSDARKLR